MDNLLTGKENQNVNLRSFTKKPRLANLELLRTISIIMVVTLHFLGHGGVLKKVEFLSTNYFILWFAESLSYVAVNCFILISGYFMIKSKFKIKKLVSLYLQILFYSISITVIFLALDIVDFNMKELIYFVLPISTNIYWFATLYFLLYIASPILNIAILNMTKQQLEIVIAVLVFIFSVISNFIFFYDTFDVKDGYSFIWFICLYFIAAYIRLYYNPNYKKNKWIVFYMSSIVILVTSRVFISIVSRYILGYVLGENLFYAYNSVLVAPASICFFLYFINLNIRSDKISKVILLLGPLSFGVYLIHEHPYMRNFIWNDLIKPSSFADNSFSILYMLMYVFLIYIAGCIIEKIRQLIFKTLKKSKFFFQVSIVLKRNIMMIFQTINQVVFKNYN